MRWLWSPHTRENAKENLSSQLLCTGSRSKDRPEDGADDADIPNRSPVQEEATNLSSITSHDGGAGSDITSRLSKKLQCLEVGRARLRLYCVPSMPPHGSESWRTTENDLHSQTGNVGSNTCMSESMAASQCMYLLTSAQLVQIRLYTMNYYM